MKKIGLFLLSFLCFMINVSAKENINNVNVNVIIANDGTAQVTEEWQINKQQNTLYTRMFNNAENTKISNLKIVDNNLSTYKKVDKINSKNSFEYSYSEKKYKKYIEFTTDGNAVNVIIQYNVEGLITNFTNSQAINWTFFSTTRNQNFGNVNIYVSASEPFTEDNVSMYAVGNNLTGEVSDGKIHLFQSFIQQKSDLKLLATVKNIKFENGIKSNKTLEKYYNNLSNKSVFVSELTEFVKENIEITISVGVLIVGIIIAIIIIVNHIRLKDRFHFIIPYKKIKELGDLSTAPYYDAIPCGGDLYKMAFYTAYYGISKSRSNLIGAILIKWYFDGIVSIEKDGEKSILRINDGKIFDRKLDLDLYNFFKDASGNLLIENNKLIRYSIENPERIIDWYDESIFESIRDEYLKRNVDVKKYKIIMNKMTYDDARKVQGLKRYLLNFNQVPRQTELNEQVYKYLIICSVLLGVDESFAKEILRKNPENQFALKLEEFIKLKNLYANIYSQTEEAYKKKKHKINKMLYNPAKKI